MRFITLITAAISVLAFASQSASALPVQDSHQGSSELLKRETTSLAYGGGTGTGATGASADTSGAGGAGGGTDDYAGAEDPNNQDAKVQDPTDNGDDSAIGDAKAGGGASGADSG
jgi:hypothetical protein